MDRVLFFILIGFMLIIIGSIFCTALAQEQIFSVSAIEGIWEGKLKVSGTELRIIFKILGNPDGTLTATLDSPDQGATGIPVEEIIFKDNTLHLEIKSAGIIYEGKAGENFSVVEGELKQSGQ
ncbi:MAG TPA: hypothetical protein ENO17_09860, partial [Candidatus Atribacteria bacterium]|nr:hypothetical protein [Candidatus Atribacteria bacterium]